MVELGVPVGALLGTVVGEAAGDAKPSQFRGVVWSPPTQKWRAEFAIDRPGGSKATLDLGYFEEEGKAAYAYDEAVRRRGHGQ